MIIVTVDLWSMGTPRRKALHTIKIGNVGGTHKRGNYYYWIYSGTRLVREGRLENFPRLSLNALALVSRVLEDAYEKDTKQIPAREDKASRSGPDRRRPQVPDNRPQTLAPAEV